METLYQAGLRNIALFTLAGFMALLLASCGRGDTQSAPRPSSATVSLSFSAMGGAAQSTAVSPLVVEVGPPDSVVTLDDFLISVQEIDLELLDESQEESDIEFEGDFIVDILNSSIQDNTAERADADLVTSLPPGTYDEVEFELIPSDQLVPGDDTTPWSVFASGSYESLTDNAMRNFVIKLNPDPLTDKDDIEVENPTGIVIAGNDNDLVLVFRLEKIFTPELLERLLTLDGEGNFVITSPSAQASEFLAVLEAALEFRETRVRIEAPVAPGDITVGESLAIMGITVNVTAATEDEDEIVSSGITSDAQIKVRGFADDNGGVLATRIRDKGAPDSDDVRLRGPVSNIPGAPVFQILGVNVDTTGATLIGPTESSLTETEFFDQLVVGAEVDVENGSFDGIDTISKGLNDMVIELKD